jgi:multidrug efflux pump subunit AcrB
MSQLVFALILGILVAYMVLASQFNSFLHPVTVLSILPLSIAGAAFALLITGKTLNIFSMIGLLLLMGIAKKNSIILVDYAVQKQGEGDDRARRDAEGRAGAPAADPDDVDRDADGRHSAGAGARSRRGDTRGRWRWRSSEVS